MLISRWLAILLLWSLTATSRAVAQDDWQVTGLAVNAPSMAVGWWYRGGSPLTRGFNVDDAYFALYAIEVSPGLQYMVQLSVPPSLRHIRVCLYDRWPLQDGARRIELPNGPVVVPPHAVRFVYRWRVGISSRSNGSMLYLLVRCPRMPGRHSRRFPRIAVLTPSSPPNGLPGKGVTYLSGPRDLVLSAGTPAVSYLLRPAEPAQGSVIAPHWTPPGDLISNGRFRAGLKNWVPQDVNSTVSQLPSVDADGLRLPAGTSVRQQLDAAVGQSLSLVLWTDLRLIPAPHGGSNAPELVIALCYRDVHGDDHCRSDAHRIRFYPATGNADGDASPVRRVPADHWYHFQTDISGVKPAPARLDDIVLKALVGKGTVRIREIHLLLRGKDDAAH